LNIFGQTTLQKNYKNASNKKTLTQHLNIIQAKIHPKKIKDYIIRQINDFVVNKTPLDLTYSNKGMSEFEKIIFVIEQTEKTLFPNGEQFMSTIIYDEYNMANGPEDLFNIIEQYIKWIDI